MQFLVVFSLLCLRSAVAGSLDLVSANFSSTLDANRLSLVMFYAPWCGISKRILPEFEAAAAPLALEGATLAKVNCVNESDIYWTHNIKGFPTFKMFFDGQVIDYEDELEMDTLTRFVNRFTQGVVTRLDSELEHPFEVFSKQRPIAMYLSDDITADFVKDFDVACKINNFAQCATSSDDSLAIHFNVELPAFVMMRIVDSKMQDEVAEDSEMTAVSDMIDWMNAASFPPLSENSADNQEIMFWRKRKGFQTHLVFFFDSTVESASVDVNGEVEVGAGSATLELAAMVGETYRHQCVVTYMDVSTRADDQYVSNMLEDLDLSDATMPNAMIIHSASKKVSFYKLVDSDKDGSTMTAESTTDWVDAFFADSLTASKTLE